MSEASPLLYRPARLNQTNQGDLMKTLSARSSWMLLLLLAAPPLMAQSVKVSPIYPPLPVEVIRQEDPSAPSGILPAQFKAAYGFNRIPNQGQGMTIALIGGADDPNIESDLAFYATYFRLAPCNFQKVKIGNPQEGGGWDIEESLDVEQACALAPQANIILVEIDAVVFGDLFNAIAVATSSPYNATTVALTFVTAEFAGEQQYDSYLCNIVNGNGQPVTIVAASGDGYHNQAVYPSTSPCVVSAGGTNLNLGTALAPPSPLQLNYGSETAWFGSTGGVSTIEPQPSWQNPACATWSTTNRCTPDIASEAGSPPSVPVYDTYSAGGWIREGGTSVAAPDWAAFFTLVNSARVAAGKSTLSQAAADLYSIYYSGNYASDFHDITSGNNGACGSECNAGPGYDLVTGMGTYQANSLYAPLVAAPN